MKTGKWMKKIGILIISIVLIFSFVSIGVTKYVYDNQFPRYDRIDETISAKLRYTDLNKDYPRQEVSFKSGKNLLRGYVYGNDNTLGLVIVAHGLGGGADSYLSQIKFFVDSGWKVFAYDSTGSYESEGKSTKGFPQSILDLNAALAYVDTLDNLNKLPILLFGHSWGGYAVANVLHFEHNIKGVVTVSGANSAMDMISEQGEKMMGPFIYTQYPFLWIYQRLLFGDVATLDAVEAINKTDTPVLIIHGTEDDMVGYDRSSIIANSDKLTNPNVEIISVSEVGRNGHNNIFKSKEASKYIEQINIEYKKLYDYHDQNIPYDINQAFYAKVDRYLVEALDQTLMQTINAFFIKMAKR